MSQNPRPRRALRKAPDSSIHPAAPVVGTATAGAAAVAPPTSDGHVAELRPVLGINGSTSDVLRRAPAEEQESTAKPKSKAGGKKIGSKSRKERRKEKARQERHERRVSLQVKVPKQVRQQLRTNAKARGTSVDDVVTTVLEGWLRS